MKFRDNLVQYMIQKNICRSVIALGQHYLRLLEKFEIFRDSSSFKWKFQVKGLSQNLRNFSVFITFIQNRLTVHVSM